MTASAHDRQILRELARRVAEIGHDPIQQRNVERWTRHNDLESREPLVLIFPEGAWRELLPENELKCTDPFWRGYEAQLRMAIYQWEHLRDDNVIEPVVPVPLVLDVRDNIVSVTSTRPDDPVGASHYECVLREGEEERQIGLPEVRVDRPATERNCSRVHDVLGDLLTVEARGPTHWWFAPLDHLATLRGVGQLLEDLYDRPAFVHRCLALLLRNRMTLLHALHAQGALSLNNRNHYTGSGGLGYTRQLPRPGFDPARVRPVDLWGMATAQIFAEVSPAMHEEFALQYERPWLAHFGLNCYGCCEPLHHKLELVKTVPNLRRVSISPWADLERSAAALGDRYILSWKPNPAVLAAETWQPEVVARDLREGLRRVRGCVVEIIMKDTHTCRNDPPRMWEWVRIAKRVAAEATC